jgi:nucleoside-diphosphate-sugar epimerase
LKIAITGATGFIGRHVTARLVRRGVDVRAIVRPESVHRAPPGATVRAAELETAGLVDALAGVDAVVHLAGVVRAVREQSFADVNVEGTRAVAAAARKIGARLIHVSSLAAAGPAPPGAPRREEDPPNPLTAYGRSKLESERVVRATEGLPWIILRPGVVYGAGDRALLPLFRLARRGIAPLIGRPTAAYTFIHVSDMVRATEAALDSGITGDTIFVGHERPVTARELLGRIHAVVGRRVVTIPIPAAIAYLAAVAGEAIGRLVGRPLPLNRSRYRELSAEGFVCSVDRLRDRLGVCARVDLDEGLAETAAWYRQVGWL